jgi:2-polyprenyl-3-methyl-5-hydroxy-6-metoxy-1,4-benzoquinol methylase
MSEIRLDQRQITANYHWRNADPPPSYAWNQPRILQVCQALKVDKILDLGCGNGALARSLARAGFNLTACDVDRNGISIAAAHNPENVRFQVLSAYDDARAIGDHDFDVVLSTEVIEHLYLPRQIPRFARRVLKPSGRLVVSTPYHGYLKNLAIAVCNRWDSHHTTLEEGGHIKFFSPRTLKLLLGQEGFQVEAMYFVGRGLYVWNGMIAVARML